MDQELILKLFFGLLSLYMYLNTFLLTLTIGAGKIDLLHILSK